MQSLPDALAPLAEYDQFFICRLSPSKDRPGKTDKRPCDLNGTVKDAHDPTIWVDAATAVTTAHMFGPEWCVGFVFTENDPFYFIDIDDCLLSDRSGWSPIASELMARFRGAAVEISQSGQGLHIIGTGRPTLPTTQRRKKAKHPETGETKDLFDLYTEKRFVALTGDGIRGSTANPVDQAQMDYIVDFWFKRPEAERGNEWTDKPIEGSKPIEDDDKLIEKMLASTSAAGTFGSSVTITDLWTGDETNYGEAFPDDQGVKDHDRNRVDAALAQHLAFWTGNNSERILRLMWKSDLVRDKWNRADYLPRTITRATSLQETFYTGGPQANADGVALAEQYGAPRLRASSDGQRTYAESIRAQKLADCLGDEETIKRLVKISTAKVWLDNQDKTPDELVAMLTPIETAANPLGDVSGPQIVSGYQYLGADLQTEYFKGFVYVQGPHKVFTPDGSFLKPDQFNSTYGGYDFQLDDSGKKTTRKAWEAFVDSQIVRWPKAHSHCFRPIEPPGKLIEEEGRILVNTYVPIETERKEGDPTPFLEHLAKMMPVESDRAILLAYMAACIQHIGDKFQWAPLLQGAPGDGKTLITRCMIFAIGSRYTHQPPAAEIAEKFNEWFFNKVFIGVEDIYVPGHKLEIIEVLKPMITNDRLAMRAMQQSQTMADNFANFILNSNHRDGYPKSKDDRRIAPFYSPMQTAEDVVEAGMGGNYFPNLYRWLRAGGYAIVNNYLREYEIPVELNPALESGGECHRAPRTSSTDEAIYASLGAIEQEILEAIDEGRLGFAGGWVSSMALERMLQIRHMSKAIPRNKRRDLMLTLGYDYHPALKEGRTNNRIEIDAGKPRLFIKNGHIHTNLTKAAEVARHYVEAQTVPPNGTSAAEAFR